MTDATGENGGSGSAAPTFIDVFSGCGGLSLGFVTAGYEPLLGIEIAGDAADTYEQNLHVPVFREGVHRFADVLHGAADVGDITIPSPGEVSVIVGGPPCQGFSRLGQMHRNGRRAAHHRELNGLWSAYTDVVAWYMPRAVVTENIPLYLKAPEYAEFVEVLHDLGYRVVADILDAADYGVPQRRKRAISVALLDGEPTLPTATVTHHQTVRDAIGHLPVTPSEDNWHVSRSPTPLSLERYRAIPPGGNRFNLIRMRPDITPRCWLDKPSGTTDVFGRLWWDRPAGTIRTEFMKPEKGRYLHPWADRAITPREAACLQSFPDDFRFEGSATSVARQIGEAVPPLLAEAVATRLWALLHHWGVVPEEGRRLRPKR